MSHVSAMTSFETAGISRHHRLVVLNIRAEHDRFINWLRDIDRPVIVGFADFPTHEH